MPALDSHDQCDAILAAYTGHLCVQGQTPAMGDPREGQIIIPGAKRGAGK